MCGELGVGGCVGGLSEAVVVLVCRTIGTVT